MSLVYNEPARRRRRMRTRWFTVSILLLTSVLSVSGAANDCSFLKDPEAFTVDAKRHQASISDLVARFELHHDRASTDGATVEAATIARKNFIDDSIFGRMSAAGIQSSPLASDAEYLRRVTFDLTGRTPSGAEADAFM